MLPVFQIQKLEILLHSKSIIFKAQVNRNKTLHIPNISDAGVSRT